MNHELIDRYIYAVARKLPGRMRADISSELRGLIQDMLEARCGSRPPAEKDVRVVLTELGAPQELARQYLPKQQHALIGPAYYESYKSLLRVILVCVAGGMLLANTLSTLLEPPEEHILLTLARFVTMPVGGMLLAFAFVTLLFALFERRGIKIDLTSSSSLDDLPPVAPLEPELKRGGIYAELVLSVLFLIVFLVAPQIIGGYFEGIGFVPLLDTAAVRSGWWAVLLCALPGLCREVLTLYEGRRNTRVLVGSIVLAAISIPLTILFIRTAFRVDPAFVAAITSLIEGDSTIVTMLFTYLDRIFMGIILFALLLDIGENGHALYRRSRAV